MVAFVQNKKGQNIVEYVLVVMAVAIVVIAFTVKNGSLAGTFNRSLSVPVNLVMQKNQEIQFPDPLLSGLGGPTEPPEPPQPPAQQ
jgi:Flp pilus assembly pilin Flp